MGLNIKNARVHELAREAARRTGKTQTGVIETALERFLADLDEPAERRSQGIAQLLAEIDAHMTDDLRAAMRHDADQMYDENGLPA